MQIAVVGATGAVGQEMCSILARRRVPADGLRLLASVRSAGTRVPYAGSDLTVLELTADDFGTAGISVVRLFVRSGLAASGKEAKRLIAEGGARLNDEPVKDAGLMLGAEAFAEPVKLSAGKKRHALATLVAEREPTLMEKKVRDIMVEKKPDGILVVTRVPKTEDNPHATKSAPPKRDVIRDEG